MPRPSLTQVLATSANLLVDNTIGLISPADIRQVFTDLVNAIRPAYAILSQSAPVVQALTTTPNPLVCSAGAVGPVIDFVLTPATCNASRTDPGVTRFEFTADVQGSSNTTRLVTFHLYRNGAPTNWKQSVSLTTSTLLVSVTFPALEYINAPANYQMKVFCDANYNVTFSNVEFLCETVAVWDYA
jgi:hypothetical protein